MLHWPLLQFLWKKTKPGVIKACLKKADLLKPSVTIICDFMLTPTIADLQTVSSTHLERA